MRVHDVLLGYVLSLISEGDCHIEVKSETTKESPRRTVIVELTKYILASLSIQRTKARATVTYVEAKLEAPPRSSGKRRLAADGLRLDEGYWGHT